MRVFIVGARDQARLFFNTNVGKGLQTMPHAAVNDFAVIGDYYILGINCSADHDRRLGDGVHVMGGAALAGVVTIGNYSIVGANATILPKLNIGENVIVGAGAVVIRDVPDNVVVAGVPARVIWSALISRRT